VTTFRLGDLSTEVMLHRYALTCTDAPHRHKVSHNDTPRVLTVLLPPSNILLTNLHLDGTLWSSNDKVQCDVCATSNACVQAHIQYKRSATSCQCFSDIGLTGLDICAHTMTCLTANAHIKGVVRRYAISKVVYVCYCN